MLLLLLGVTDAATDGWGALPSWLPMLSGVAALACYAAWARMPNSPR